MGKSTPLEINFSKIPESKANLLARSTLRCVREALANPAQKAVIDRRIQETHGKEDRRDEAEENDPTGC